MHCGIEREWRAGGEVSRVPSLEPVATALVEESDTTAADLKVTEGPGMGRATEEPDG